VVTDDRPRRCHNCANLAEPGRVRCERCAELHRDAQAARREYGYFRERRPETWKQPRCVMLDPTTIDVVEQLARDRMQTVSGTLRSLVLAGLGALERDRRHAAWLRGLAADLNTSAEDAALLETIAGCIERGESVTPQKV